ncbi:MAG: HPr family phosphocarrier protein [Pseudomonadota bacterium]
MAVDDEPARVLSLTLTNIRGLHARAAAKFVQTVERHEAEVTVEKDGQTVSGRSIMGLLMLGAGVGTSIAVTIEGSDRDEAAAAIKALVDDRFGEVE